MDLKIGIGLAALAVLALGGLAFAHMGGFGGMMGGGGFLGNSDITDDARIQFMKAMWTGDYEAMKSLSEQYGMGGRMMKLADEESFRLMGEMHSAMAAGDYETALEIQKELQQKRIDAMKNANFTGGGFGRGMMGGCPMHNQAE